MKRGEKVACKRGPVTKHPGYKTTLTAWDHIWKEHKEWARELMALPEDDWEDAIKKELKHYFPGIIG